MSVSLWLLWLQIPGSQDMLRHAGAGLLRGPYRRRSVQRGCPHGDYGSRMDALPDMWVLHESQESENGPVAPVPGCRRNMQRYPEGAARQI